jgi:branched-chain amino acid transport system ATP-binding protein
VLELSDVTAHYGGVQALHGVSLEVRRGETVALVGANGAGKTTLLHCISGVHPLSGGALRFDGDDLRGVPPHRRVARGVVQVPEGRQVFAPMSVEDNLLLGAFLRTRSAAEATLAQVFALFPVLAERRRSLAGALSGGQQQMLAIGRALMAQPRLLLFDEPSMGLAPVIAGEIYTAIAALRRGGTTMLIVEQNAIAAIAVADRGVVLETGRVVHDGPAASLRHDDRLRRAYLGA